MQRSGRVEEICPKCEETLVLPRAQSWAVTGDQACQCEWHRFLTQGPRQTPWVGAQGGAWTPSSTGGVVKLGWPWKVNGRPAWGIGDSEKGAGHPRVFIEHLVLTKKEDHWWRGRNTQSLYLRTALISQSFIHKSFPIAHLPPADASPCSYNLNALSPPSFPQ
jgi:hypothetical protein